MKTRTAQRLKTRLAEVRAQMKGMKRVGFRSGKWGEETVYSDGSVVSIVGDHMTLAGNIGECFKLLAKLEGMTFPQFFKTVLGSWLNKKAN